MKAWLRGDLTGLHLPGDLERLREELSYALAAGEPITLTYEALAAQAPPALLDLALGPRALADEEAVRAALALADALEAMTTPSALYRRLATLAPALAPDILALAAARHPSAKWLVAFGEKAERNPGATQLKAARSHPAYSALCFAHAEAGHLPALLLEARTGRAQPVAALLAVGAKREAINAAAVALKAAPNAPVVPYLAAIGGPDIGELLAELAARPLPAAARARLAADLPPFPFALAALSRGAEAGDSG